MNGFSYIELVIAMALLVIILTPVLPAINQAHANHRYAVSRHKAQGRAAVLALEVRASPNNASAILQQRASDDFIYRLSLLPTGGGGGIRQYTAGDEELLPPSTEISFQTNFGGLFTDGLFIVAEVFDNNGNLAGLSVSKAFNDRF